MQALLHDLRVAMRSLRNAPAFTLAAVLTLALGIGANTAIFSIVDGVLLRPAPFDNIDRLAMIWETDRASGTTREPSANGDFFDFQARSRRFDQIAAIAAVELNVNQEGSDPQRIAALGVSHEFLPMVGIEPIAGRHLTAEETRLNGPLAAMISEDLWEQMFQRSASAIGGTVRLNEQEWTVVGVLPRGADFGTLQILRAADYGRGFAERGGQVRVDAWIGVRANPAASRGGHGLLVVGRLAQGVTRAAAQAELTAITADLEREYAETNVNRGAFVEPIASVVFGPVRTAMWLLLGAVGLVLLVACANVANLLLVRGTARMREITVRVALGAGFGRLIRQFLVEGAVLAGAGALLGVLFAVVALDALLAWAPATLPRIGSVEVDVRVLAVMLTISAMVAIGFGVLPALQARRASLTSALRGGGRGASAGRSQNTLRSALVIGELAMAVMLMVGAGLLVRSLWNVQGVDPGFTATGVVKAEYQLPASRYPRNFATFPRWPEQERFNTELLRRVRALPTVQSASIAGNHPLDAGFTSSIVVVGREPEAGGWPEPAVRLATPGYAETMQVPVREGRAFTASDDPDAPAVVMINDAAKARYFGGGDALGQQIALWGQTRTVVGVIGNERSKGLVAPPPPGVYLPLGQLQMTNGSHSLLVRTSGDADAMAASIRGVLRELDPQLPIFGVEPLSATLRNSVGERRFTMLVLAAFAGVALVLAGIGVHGVLAYTVSQRTRELGIRVALGAGAREVQSLVLGRGVMLTATGLALGLAGALALAQVLSSLLFGVSARDPLTFVAVAASLGAVALAASYLPARRAARTDPLITLRAE